MITTLEEVKAMLKHRNPLGHKGTFGHGLLIAGSCGMAGAAILGGRAALRSGIGKLTIVSPECNRIIIQTALPEAVVQTTLPDDLSFYDAVAVGPGIGQSDEAREMLDAILRCKIEHLVIDADGLNNLPASWQHDIPRNAVITPHLGEWKRLLSHDNKYSSHDALSDYIDQVHEVAKSLGIYVVLKAARHANFTNIEGNSGKIANVAIFSPDENKYLNTTGNNGMATAGSGDVLTGILLAFLSQGYDYLSACRLSAWIHGKAGDFAADKLGMHSMIASDIVNNLSNAFKTII